MSLDKKLTLFDELTFLEESKEAGVPTAKVKRVQAALKDKKMHADIERLWIAYYNQIKTIYERILVIRDMPPAKAAAWRMYKAAGITDLTEQILLEEQHIKLKAVWLELPCFKKEET